MPRLKKATAKVRALKVAKGLRKHKGSVANLAKELGITRQAVQKKLNNPEFISLRQQAINAALKRAGITEDFLYGKLKKALEAKAQASYLGQVFESQFDDHGTQLRAIPITLELFQHLNVDVKEDSKPTEVHIHYGHRTKPKEDNGNGT